jgi:hypothetical protein
MAVTGPETVSVVVPQDPPDHSTTAEPAPEVSSEQITSAPVTQSGNSTALTNDSSEGVALTSHDDPQQDHDAAKPSEKTTTPGDGSAVSSTAKATKQLARPSMKREKMLNAYIMKARAHLKDGANVTASPEEQEKDLKVYAEMVSSMSQLLAALGVVSLPLHIRNNLLISS